MKPLTSPLTGHLSLEPQFSSSANGDYDLALPPGNFKAQTF